MTATRYRVRPNAIFAELGDGTGVVLDLQTKAYFTLNATGVLVWKALAAGPSEIGQVARTLSDAFKVDRERAETDVAAIVHHLDAENLVESALE